MPRVSGENLTADASACPIRPSSDSAAGMCGAHSLPGCAVRIGAADGGRQSGTAAISDSSAAEPGRDFASPVLSVNESPGSNLIVAFHSFCGLLRDHPNVSRKKCPKTHFFNGMPAIAEVERAVSRETQFHSAQTPAARFITADYFPSRPWTIEFTRDRIKRDPGPP
jgi:hypothetical protein